MRLKVCYWKDEIDKIADIDVEFDKEVDYDYVPYGESEIKRMNIEYDVFIIGDIPDEIKDDIRKKFHEYRRFYSGFTENWEYEAQ